MPIPMCKPTWRPSSTGLSKNVNLITATLARGDDDMPAHAKSTLTGTSLTIPITNHRLNMGIWQGIYLCEFRNGRERRKIVATIIGE